MPESTHHIRNHSRNSSVGQELSQLDAASLAVLEPPAVFNSQAEMRSFYIRQAKARAEIAKRALAESTATSSYFTPTTALSIAYGIGIGLYLRVLQWLTWLFVILCICAVPFMVTITTSVFTDASHKDANADYGYQVYPELQISSFSFGAIVGPNVDNNTLQFVNTRLVNQWMGPESKSFYLKWISYVDASSAVVALLLAIYFLHLAIKFVTKVDKRSLEVSDFTVLVHGLPQDVTPEEVGEHFGRFGEVIEVQLICDLEPVLSDCKRISRLEEKLQLARDQLGIYRTAAYMDRVKRLEAELEREMIRIDTTLTPSLLSLHPVKNSRFGLSSFIPPVTPSRAGGGSYASGLMNIATPRLTQAPRLPLIQEFDDVIMSSGHPSPPPSAIAEIHPDITSPPDQGTTAAAAAARGMMIEEEERLGLPVKMAFITFNLQSSVKRCIDSCPSGAWSSFFGQKMIDRFRYQGSIYDRWSNGGEGEVRASAASSSSWTHAPSRFWVERTKPPEDYIYENLAYGSASHFVRKTITRLVILGVLLFTAAVITALSGVSNSATSLILWQSSNIASDVASAFAPMLQSFKSSGVAGSQAANSNLTSLCMQQLDLTCTDLYSLQYGSSLVMSYGSLLTWSNATESLFMLRPAIQALQQSSVSSTACYPCFCMGLRDATPLHSTDATWIASAKSECQTYINKWDAGIWGQKIAIAIVIAVINSGLKILLDWFLVFEKHWTRSGVERTYAVLTFASQFLNSAVVLLLVNAAPLRDAATRSESSAVRTSTLRSFLLNGRYNDFSQGWYEDVGVPILILMLINLTNPLMTLWADQAFKMFQRCTLLLFPSDEASTRDRYIEAFAPPDFNLQQRVADAMLMVMLGLTFGTGLPLAHGITAVALFFQGAVDRRALMGCKVSSRYDADLPRLMIDVLPWGILLHCCLGLWMHTYFTISSLSVDQLQVALEKGASQALSALNSGLNRSYLFRITQPNGIPMLFAGTLVLLWILWSLIVSPLMRSKSGVSFVESFKEGCSRYCCCLFGSLCCCNRWVKMRLMSSSPEDDLPLPSLQDAHPRPRHQGPMSRSASSHPLRSSIGSATAQPSAHPRLPRSYSEALTLGSLNGATTYRVDHHPRYSHMFSNGSKLTKAILIRAMGSRSFTRLISTGGARGNARGGRSFDGVIIGRTPNRMRLTPGGMVRTQADVSDIERASRAMPSSLALVVQSMSRVTPTRKDRMSHKFNSLSPFQPSPPLPLPHSLSIASPTTPSVHFTVLAEDPRNNIGLMINPAAHVDDGDRVYMDQGLPLRPTAELAPSLRADDPSDQMVEVHLTPPPPLPLHQMSPRPVRLNFESSSSSSSSSGGEEKEDFRDLENREGGRTV